jgi:hypothetical protein
MVLHSLTLGAHVTTKHRRLILVTSIALLALSLGAVTATALRSLELRNAGAITANAARLSFTEAGGVVLTFNVTLAGRLEGRIAKTAGARVGQIETCTANEGRDTAGLNIVATIKCELNRPWPINYNSINGTLPRINSVLVSLEGLSLLFSSVRERLIRLNECLFVAKKAFNERGTAINEPIGADTTTASPIREITIQATRNTAKLGANLEEANQACAREIRMAGRFILTAAQTLILV